ncbi:LysR family transcriptional regulator [Shewanella sp. YIC-542]|uniref:LysR family transcriptional regulator n=1 Tax=Shewanella mytili TaxID=3377111 RepID=UPI00398EF00E
MKFEKLNYTSLVVYESMCRHKNAGLVSNELSMSVSAISRQLALLRDIFQDTLFIRRAYGFVLTDKATKMLPYVRDILSKYDNLRTSYTMFSPAASTGHFRIYAYDEFTYTINKVIFERIATQVPDVTFEVRTLAANCSRALENGDIDFAVIYENFGGDKIRGEMISPTEDIYLLSRNNHPVLETPLAVDDIIKCKYICLDNFNDLDSPLIKQLALSEGKDIDVIGATDNIASLGRHILDTNCISMTCNAFTCEYFTGVPGIQVTRLSREFSEKLLSFIQVGRTPGNYLVYSEINSSPLHQWLKTQLFEGIQDEWYSGVEMLTKQAQ